jgi:hypothetical protein
MEIMYEERDKKMITVMEKIINRGQEDEGGIGRR